MRARQSLLCVRMCALLFLVLMWHCPSVQAEGPNLLANPGFESCGPDGAPEGWSLLARLDPNGYGAPDYSATFDAVRPVCAPDGRDKTAGCAAFPARGVWHGDIRDHNRPGGREDVRGTDFAKAALHQTVTLPPGRYVFSAHLRTADGDAFTAAFSLGWQMGPAVFAGDSSTGIHWTAPDLSLCRSFDGTGTLGERGEWARYETGAIEVAKTVRVTVWIRFNYANNNSMRTRWQVDDVCLSLQEEVAPRPTVGIANGQRTGSPLAIPADGQAVIDCGDYGDRYLIEDTGSAVVGELSHRLFQHARRISGDASFTYDIPVDSHLDVVCLAFEHMGPYRMRVGDTYHDKDTEAGEDTLYPREYVFTDRSLWRTGVLRVRFEAGSPRSAFSLLWLEAGATTRFRERLRHVQWDTVSVPWRVGLWDFSPQEFGGTQELFRVGESGYRELNASAWRVEWNQRLRPGCRYHLVLGHIRTKEGEQGGYGYIDVGDDGSAEYVSRTDGEEAMDFDVTDLLLDGPNVVRLRADAIDYAALIETQPGVTDLTRLGIFFGGDELAENITRVLHTSLFWMLSGHYDDSGFLDASVPHGKWWRQYWPIDIAFGLQTLIGYGKTEQAERVARLVAAQGWAGHSTNRSGGADNNGGSILALGMCELIRRSAYRNDLVEDLWPQIRAYCQLLMDESSAGRFGLVKGTNWENAGNREQGPCYSLSTNLLAVYALRKAADCAEEGRLAGDPARWRAASSGIRKRVLEQLVFREDVQSPTGWTFPAGTWAYGMLDDGSFMLNPLAGYFWAGELASAYFGMVDLDTQLRDIYARTVRAAMPLFDRGQTGVVSGYASSYDGPASTFGTAALSDDLESMGRLVDEFEREMDYRDDKGSTKAELSRWAYGSPGWVEDTNLVGVAEFLNWPRYVAGIDDTLFGGVQLRLAPRLPSRWKHCGVNDWPVQFVSDTGRSSTRLSMRYERGPYGFEMRVRTEHPVRGLRVRLGPFPGGSQPRLAQGSYGTPDVMQNRGGSLWLWVSVDSGPEWRSVRCISGAGPGDTRPEGR